MFQCLEILLLCLLPFMYMFQFLEILLRCLRYFYVSVSGNTATLLTIFICFSFWKYCYVAYDHFYVSVSGSITTLLTIFLCFSFWKYYYVAYDISMFQFLEILLRCLRSSYLRAFRFQQLHLSAPEALEPLGNLGK